MALSPVSPLINRGIVSDWLQDLPAAVEMLTVDTDGNVSHQAIPVASFAALTGAPGDNTALAAALAGKASTGHTHSISDVSSLQAALDAKLNLSGGTLTGSLAGVSISLVAATDTPLSVASNSTNVTTFGVVNSSSGIGWAFQVGGSSPGTGAPAGSFTFRQTTSDINTGIIASDGRWSIGAGVPLASTQLAVASRSASNIAGVFRGASSQTANLTEWQNSSATVLASVSASGAITSSGALRLSTHDTGLYFGPGGNTHRISSFGTDMYYDVGAAAGRHLFRSSSSTASLLTLESSQITAHRAISGTSASFSSGLSAASGSFTGQVNAGNLMLNNFQWIGWGGTNYIAADGAGVRLNFVPLNQVTTFSCVTANISGLLNVGTYTVATLPSAAANAGALAQVTDSSVTSNGSAVAGGGSNRVVVFSNGSTWDVVVA